MATPPLPPAYVERMTSLLGDEAEAFFASYDRPARPGLRVNPNKITPDGFRQRSPWPLEPVPWCPTGFYLPEDAPAGKHPWHAAGVYYLQEPSAMAPVEILDPSPGEWVADVCAAPGGKSTQILDRLTHAGLLVANDVVGSRIKPLGENLERWGADVAVISNQEVSRVAALEATRFDRVLVDAPCSGEGLFRRTPDARTEWSVAHVEGSARRQRGLVEAAARLVIPGGELVYSTCTFAPEENELVIAAFLDTHPDWEVVPIGSDLLPGATGGRADWTETTHDLSEIARLWPHRVEGDGHTIARLRRRDEVEEYGEKPEGARLVGLPSPSKIGEQELSDFVEAFVPGFSIDSVPVQQGESLFMFPVSGEKLGMLPLVRKGLWVGTVAPGRFTPSHAFALYLHPGQCALVEPLEFAEAARYLSGETLTKPGKPGWVLIAFDGFPLGWGKRSGDVIKNHYPKGLRRPVSSWMSAA
jgi:NOL1/NOP2/sun family putative RNA methylase